MVRILVSRTHHGRKQTYTQYLDGYRKQMRNRKLLDKNLDYKRRTGSENGQIVQMSVFLFKLRNLYIYVDWLLVYSPGGENL